MIRGQSCSSVRHCERSEAIRLLPLRGKALDCFASFAMTAVSSDGKTYSMTACSGTTDCLRSVALLEPIMIVSGIAHSVKIITIW